MMEYRAEGGGEFETPTTRRDGLSLTEDKQEINGRLEVAGRQVPRPK
jgi:hypothetical protein